MATEILPSLPFRVEIEVINRCNIKPACDYCYAGPFDGKTIELEDLKFVISKTERQVSPFEVIFLGGEPFLRSDMVDILEFAKITFSTHLLSMSTNGTMLKTLSEDKLARLRALSEGNPLIQVSIDSTRNPTVQKSLRSLEGIMVLEKHDIPFNIGIVITRRNLHNYLETLDDLLKFPHLMGINAESLQKTSEPYYNQNRLTLEEEYLVVPSIEKLAAERSRTDVYIVNSNKNHCLFQMLRGDGRELKPEDRRITNAGVYVNGNVSMDGALGRHQIVGNVFKEDWRTIWENAIRVFREEKATKLRVVA